MSVVLRAALTAAGVSTGWVALRSAAWVLRHELDHRRAEASRG